MRNLDTHQSSLGNVQSVRANVASGAETAPSTGKLNISGYVITVIFMAADTDRSIRLRLVEQRALECQFKPFSGTALLDALRVALPAD